MLQKTFPTAIFLALSSYAIPTLAQQSLAPVVVTANRVAQTADQTLASVTTISRQDIERRQASSVIDLLRGEAGLNFASNGGPGQPVSLFMRGTESDQVLVLIDGVKVGSATLGSYAFQDLPVELIDHIEIVRGPRSSLYGSEAVGGVIQIFTRRGGGPLKIGGSLGVASNATRQGALNLSGGGDKGWFQITANGLDTDGFNACTGKPFPGGAGCFTIESDDDAHSNFGGTLRAGYRFDNGLSIDAHLLQSRAKTEFDGGFANQSANRQQVYGSTLSYSGGDLLQLSLNLGRSTDDSQNFLNGVTGDYFDTIRDTVSLQNNFNFGTNSAFTLGLDYQNDNVESNQKYSVSSRNNTGVFGQLRTQFASNELQFSLRSDDNEQFGQYTTGGVSWAYPLTNKLRLLASYGTAFRAPNFNELYYPNFGNPNLSPEESASTELGLSGTLPVGNWSASIYRTKIDHMIGFDAAFNTVNVDQARIQGAEVQFNTVLLGWDVASNVTLLDPQNRSAGANYGKLLARRTKQSASISADRRFGQFSFGSSVRAEGERYDNAANTLPIGGYTTVDLRGEYQLAKDLSLQLRLQNAFDKSYETAAYYNQPGREVFLTLRYQPK